MKGEGVHHNIRRKDAHQTEKDEAQRDTKGATNDMRRKTRLGTPHKREIRNAEKQVGRGHCLAWESEDEE
eukprot:4728556-Karenia_brevis.AAC.1